MPQRSIVSTSTRLIREFGGQVAVSVAASAVAAAFLAAPDLLLLPGDAARATTARQHDEANAWVSTIAPDGKITIRHRQAAADDVRVAVVPLQPAMLMMPMSVAWPQAAFDDAPMLPARARAAEAHAVTAMAPPPRKPPERARVADAAPLPIMPVRLTTQDGAVAGATAQQSSSDQPTPSTLARVGNVMSGAVGTVGAAGIWTLSQASSLLPRL